MSKSVYPIFYQEEWWDCGLACLKMICENHNVDSSDFLSINSFDPNKIPIDTLKETAEKIGFNAIAVRTNLNKITENDMLPCILHWRNTHYVVLYKAGDDQYLIGDPTWGLKNVSLHDFTKNWIVDGNLGIALLLVKTNNLKFYQRHVWSNIFWCRKVRNIALFFFYEYYFRKGKIVANSLLVHDENGESRILENLEIDLSKDINCIYDSISTNIISLLSGREKRGAEKISLNFVCYTHHTEYFWRRVGYVGRDVFVFDGSILENINPRDAKINNRQLQKAIRISRIPYYFGTVDIMQDVLNVFNLSEQQIFSLVLARTLLLKPKVIFLEDVTEYKIQDVENIFVDIIRCYNCRIVISSKRNTPLICSGEINYITLFG